MYPEELRNFINERGCLIKKSDLLLVIDIDKNPQLNHVTYNGYDNSYDMWDCYGNYYHFSVVE